VTKDGSGKWVLFSRFKVHKEGERVVHYPLLKGEKRRTLERSLRGGKRAEPSTGMGWEKGMHRGMRYSTGNFKEKNV